MKPCENDVSLSPITLKGHVHGTYHYSSESPKVFNSADLNRFAEVKFLVDSGAGHSVVPGAILRQLGIEPHGSKTFFMADGTGIERQVGGAVFEYLGERAHAPVIFGEEGDEPLMGTTTLEGLGFVLDPFRRELRPAVMRL